MYEYTQPGLGSRRHRWHAGSGLRWQPPSFLLSPQTSLSMFPADLSSKAMTALDIGGILMVMKLDRDLLVWTSLNLNLQLQVSI
eukprot:SAG31_NODE_1469_length_8221_cov_3.165230_1_plen_84_part_00